MLILDGKAMTTDTVERVAAGESVQLDPAAMERVAEAWRTITAISFERPVYGRTTGVGANRDIVISPDEQRAHGRRLIESHATALGPLLPPLLVRAMIGVRVNQLAAGGSGISPEVVTALVGLLSRDVVPPVRDGGSIGTGDLPALGQIARALDVELAGGDALALMSSNALTLARAALGSAALQRLAQAGLAVTALTVRAADGNVEAFCETVHGARPHEGQRAAAAAIRSLLEAAGPWQAARMQDNYGLRAAAQVAGPLLDAAARLDRTLGVELNAVAENPMVDVAGRRVLHNGNFHLAALALDLDAARVALYQAASLSVARLADLLEPSTTGLAPFLAAEPAGSSGALGLEYVAHAALARLAQAARATTLATATLSRGVEGHAPFAPQGARQLELAIAAGRDVLACELVAALRALRQKSVELSGPLGEAVAKANAVIDADMTDRDLSPDLDAAVALLALLDDLAALTPQHRQP